MTDKMEKEVLERICAVCVDRRDDGSCGLDTGLRCSIELHLPGILGTLENVSSPRLKDYVERIRRTICAVCEEHGPGDSCEVRERADCPLDRYLMLVVEAIEDLRSREDAEVMASAPRAKGRNHESRNCQVRPGRGVDSSRHGSPHGRQF